jgi:adenine-specific DNA glycosylase
LRPQSWLPLPLWDEVPLELIGFGQETCTPLRPRCGGCPVRELCPSAECDSGSGGGAAPVVEGAPLADEAQDEAEAEAEEATEVDVEGAWDDT